MLPEDRKEQIRLEEIYRAEIRQEISFQSEPEKNWVSGLFKSQRSRFVATAFIIPLFLWLFAYFQAEMSAAKEAERFTSRVTLEVKERVIQHNELLRQGSPMFFTNINRTHLYPEFSGWGMSVLLVELSNKNKNLSSDALKLMKQGFQSGSHSKILNAAASLGWVQQ